MKEKLFLFLVLVLIACAMVFFGSETKKIVCSNRNHTCYMLTENSLLKSSKEGHIFDVSHKNENVTNDFGDNPDLGHFVCKARRSSVHENSKRKNKIRYYLAPFPQRHDLKFSRPRALNSYSSLAACETDKQVLESYLDSDENEDLVYETSNSRLNFLFYIGASVILLFGLYVLIFGKAVSQENSESAGFVSGQKKDFYEKTREMISEMENELRKSDEDKQ